MSEIDPELLKRYASGQCSTQEIELVEHWLDQDEGASDPNIFEGVDKTDLKKGIWHEIQSAPIPKKSKFYIPSYLYKVAVCFILALFMGYYAVNLYKNSAHHRLTAVALVYKEVIVPKGRKAQITLTDGTFINVNSDSRLKYPVEFTGHTRVVYLTGEAHFHVAKDRTKPFIIHTARTDTRVLGTIFNVKSYPEESTTTVTVEEGRVQFSLASNPTKQLILTANLQGIAGAEQQLELQKVYAGNYTAWKNEKLIFNNLNLKEIAPLLNRWYNVNVAVGEKKLETERFTGTYQHAALNAIAEDISQALHCHYKLNAQSLLFY